MTTTGNPFNPYQSPDQSGNSTAGVDGGPRQRPGGLTAVCAIAIALGALGLCSSLLGLLSLAVQPSLQKAFTMPQQPGMPEGFVKAQADMQKKIQDVGLRYWGFNVGISLLNLAIGACLLVGGIMALKMHPKAGSLLIAVFAAGIVFEIAAGVVTVIMQLDMAKVMSEAMPQMMMAAGPKGAPGAEQGAALMATFTKVGAYVGMAISLGWALAKMVFYGVSACYLRRPNIRQLFQAPPTDEM